VVRLSGQASTANAVIHPVRKSGRRPGVERWRGSWTALAWLCLHLLVLLLDACPSDLLGAGPWFTVACAIAVLTLSSIDEALIVTKLSSAVQNVARRRARQCSSTVKRRSRRSACDEPAADQHEEH